MVKNELVIPTIKYFGLHEEQIPFKWYSQNDDKCLFLTKMSFPFVSDRLKYGLPISIEEYNDYKSKSLI